MLAENQCEQFDRDSIAAFFTSAFTVSSQSDRMGYRLSGPTMTLRAQREMISESVSFGSIQLPPDGNPIVLMADRQTTGGYPKMAAIATVDLPVMAQVQPGGHVRFELISLQSALNLLRRQARRGR